MHIFISILVLLFSNFVNITERPTPEMINVAGTDEPVAGRASQLSITFPKNNQKVRGDYKIYGKATPGTPVKLTVTSKYFKTAHDNHERISKGEGPLNRMNRKFTLTTDRNGTWMLKSIEFRNAGWEESFTIKATADGKTVTVNVYDNTRPVNID